jgi:uncharacterized HAD superfamily protein
VLADLHSVLLEEFSKIANRRITADMITRWDIADSIKPGLTSAYYKAWDDYQPEHIASYEEDADLSVERLRETAPVDIVTAHAESSRRSIERWLSLNRISYDNLVLVGRGSGAHKLSLAGNHDTFIDDNPNLAASAPNNVLVLLYSQPWNRQVLKFETKRNVIRIRSLREVPDLLSNIRSRSRTTSK